MKIGICEGCRCEVKLSPIEIEILKNGVGDSLVKECPGCGAQLYIKNPFKKDSGQKSSQQKK